MTARAERQHSSPGRQMLGSLARTALNGFVTLGGRDNRLSILIYHRILGQPDALFPGELDAAAFDQQLGHLCSCFNVISLAEGVHGLRTGTLPPRAACITFDDGYADTAEIALPILQQHGVGATVFVASGFLHGERMWNDTVIELVRAAPGPLELRGLGGGTLALDSAAARRAAIGALLGKLKYLPLAQRQDTVDALCAQVGVELPANLMMTPAHLRRLHAAGIEIGAHTVNHPILTKLGAAQARREIADGRDALEEIIGNPVRLFAFPNGKPGRDYGPEHVAMVRELGFDAAVSTSGGVAAAGSDMFQLPRVPPWGKGQLRFTLRLMRNFLQPVQKV